MLQYPLGRGGRSPAWRHRRMADPTPSAPISTSPVIVLPPVSVSTTPSGVVSAPAASLIRSTDSMPTASRRAPCTTGRSATCVCVSGGAPRSRNSKRRSRRPSRRRTSPLAGAELRAAISRAMPSSCNAAIAFGARASAKPSSRGVAARSTMRISQPARRSASPAARPPIPAPTMRAVRGPAMGPADCYRDRRLPSQGKGVPIAGREGRRSRGPQAGHGFA
jgi:hypothetical protein